MELNAMEQIKKFQEFIEQEFYQQLLENLRKGLKYLIIDFNELSEYDPDLAMELLNQPEEILRAIEKGIEQFDMDGNVNVRVRVKNIPKSTKYMIGDVRANLLGKFITLEGFLLRKSEVKPQVTSCRFECSSCGNIVNILQLDDRFKQPTRCGCGFKGKFNLLDKELIDVQSLVVQEKQEDLVDTAAQPQRIHIILKEDLVMPIHERKMNPGTIVLVNGILKEIPTYMRTGEQSTKFNLLVEANYIEPQGETFEEIKISEKEEEKILEISKKDPIKLFVEAVAPTIFGNEKLKEAVILQLFGGVRKILQDDREVRGDSHILIIGDPGVAKTALLRAVAKFTPKWQYISGGEGTSGRGISASVVKDELLKCYTLDAGAGVLAHNGILFFDELDKMKQEERASLHEMMESQSFTVHKAGINATLLARTTILAAANPKIGRFDPYTELYTQLNIPPTLINRFDLIFPLKDIPEEHKDDKMARHILKSHRKLLDLEKPKEGATSSEINPFLNKQFTKKYIAYAKRKISPEITDEAEDVIHSYYINLRKQANPTEGKAMAIPINARYLEGIIRVGEEYARARLSKKVSKEDAQRAVDLIDYCLKQFGYDPETGKIDMDRISGVAMPVSKKNIRETIFSIFKEAKEGGRNSEAPLSYKDVFDGAKSKGISEDETEEIVHRMKEAGDLFEPRSGYLWTLF